MTASSDYKGVVFITGAASGIGEATVRAFVAHGFAVAGADVNDAAGAALFEELGGPHAFYRLDVRDRLMWADTLALVVAKFGGIDILHLNAGVTTRSKGAPFMDDPLRWFDEGHYRKVIDVNLDGVAFGIMAALSVPALKRIVVTASGSSLLPVSFDPLYTASKFGVLGLVLALEDSLRSRGIRIDAICPGLIETSLTPPDIEATLHQEPVSFIAESVIKIATGDAPGPVWLALTEQRGLERYTMPGIPGMSDALDVAQS